MRSTLLQKRADAFSEDGYWVGEDRGASGILPVCPATKTICLAWRSPNVHVGNCWGTIGGAIKEDTEPGESAGIELTEETGYTGPITIHPAYTFRDGDFSYRNFIGVVPAEFKFQPKPGFGWETSELHWTTLEDLEAEMEDSPSDFHFGLIALFKHSRNQILQLLGE